MRYKADIQRIFMLVVLSTVRYKYKVGESCCLCVCVGLIEWGSVFIRGFFFFQNEDTHQPPH